jgi:2-polyprenyl-3-methyl-5-hydroxy-6-metoxy-1,4-benzoquinol methylase
VRQAPNSPDRAGRERSCEICGRLDFDATFEKAGHRYARCRGCGLERIDPPPSDAELSRIYGRHYYDAWGVSEAEHHVRELKKATFRHVLSAAGTLPPNAPILDCGAATGFLMEVAAEMGYDPYGVELSSYGADLIAMRFGSEHLFEGELEHARFPRVQAFAAIFMCDYLEHVRDPMTVLRRAAAFLPAGSPLVISTPQIGSVTQRLMRAGWPHYKTEHLYYFSPDNLRLLFRQTGFAHVERRPARKTLSIDYIRHYFEAYPHAALTRLARLLRRLPQRARERHIAVPTGEMLVVARRLPATDADPLRTSLT